MGESRRVFAAEPAHVFSVDHFSVSHVESATDWDGARTALPAMASPAKGTRKTGWMALRLIDSNFVDEGLQERFDHGW